jgi:Na+-driven multidrug efflux pump
MFASVMHFFWSYFLVSTSQLNLGITGTGISMVIANLTVLLVNLIYTASCEDIKEAVFMPDIRCTQEIRQYLRLGVPSALMFILDVWAGSMVRFFSGYLSVDI